MSASPTLPKSKSSHPIWRYALHKFGTPLTAGLFLVSTVSGVALFFRWAPMTFHSMHEWLSMILLIPFVLHVVKNWKPVVAYAKRKTLFFVLALCLIAAIPFAMPKKDGRAGNPGFRALQLVRQTPLTDLAPIFKMSPDALIARLKQSGFQVADGTQSLDDVAAASHAQANDLLVALMAGERRHGR